MNMTNLIVFSHLRWNFVYQRPQHLMTRLAEHYRITFVEEPVFDEGESFLEIQDVGDNIRVARPHTPIHAPGYHDDQLPEIAALVQDLLLEDDLDDYMVWFYTPMAFPLLKRLDPSVVIYDCMDELSAFKNAPRELLLREKALLKAANLVFTGGPSLYRAKQKRHPEVYCFSSSVDSVHFAQARGMDEHPDQTHLPGPRLGFYGVIDERFDIDLVGAVAAARPDWQLVLVGPVVKIDEAALPRAANIHYMGQQSYDNLPKFLAGWNVCLLPFALNESTRFISPTKTLEYMAAEKPIVSTPITDVVEPYGHIVHIAREPGDFIAACEQALNETPEQAVARVAKMRSVLAKTSWDTTTAAMYTLMERARAKSQLKVARALLNPAALIAGKRAAQPAMGLTTGLGVGVNPA